ncbi:MAG: hypothetical protein ABW252_04265 [Polyangiales bacterium]
MTNNRDDQPDPSVRARLLAALRGPERFTPFALEVAHLFAIAPDDAREALRRIDDAEAWEAGPWPRSRFLRTPALTAASALIARLPAGLRIGDHAHAGRELTYILDGEVVESGSERVLGRGALLDKAAGSRHEVGVVGTTDCLVVFALRAV